MTPTEQTLARLLFASARRLYRTTLLGVPCKAFDDTKAEVLYPRPGDWVLDVSSLPGAGPSSIRNAAPPSFRGAGPASARGTGPLSSIPLSSVPLSTGPFSAAPFSSGPLSSRGSGPSSARSAEPAGESAGSAPSSSSSGPPAPSSVAGAAPVSTAAVGPSSVAGAEPASAAATAPSSVTSATSTPLPGAASQRPTDVDLNQLGRLVQIANEDGERVWYVEGLDGALYRRPGAEFIRVFEHPLAATTDEERLAWVVQALKRHGLTKQDSVRPTW